ncbi:hypothetical protein LINPERHAP2_LOCUS10919 [Linum perenne]
MLNHEDLSKERLEKMKKALKNQREKNQFMEMQLLLKEDLTTTCGCDLDFVAKEKLNEVRPSVIEVIDVLGKFKGLPQKK